MSSGSAPITPPLSPVLVRSKKKRCKVRESNFDEDNFTPSPSEDPVTLLERLDAIEKDRKNHRNFFKNDTPVPVHIPVATPLPIPCVVPRLNIDIPVNTTQLDAPLEIPKDFSGFRTCAGKEVIFSQEILEENLKLFEDILMPSQSTRTKSNKFSYLTRSKQDDSGSSAFKGFEEEEVRTAQLDLDILLELGKRLDRKEIKSSSVDIPNTPEEEMEIDDLNLRKRTRDKIEPFDTALGEEMVFKKSKVELFQRDKGCAESSKETSESSLHCMFSSASGKPLKPSESPHLKADDIFKDVTSDWESGRNVENVSAGENGQFAMFSTASGKAFKPSESALQKANKIFKDVENFDLGERTENKPFPMFSTASRKAFKPSESAFQKANKLFKDVDNLDSGERIENEPFATFSTASGKAFKPSETALQKANKLFKDVDNLDSGDWKCAKNKENASTCLPSKETSEKCSLPMFSSVSGKPFKPSQTALQKANKIFKDVDNLDSADWKIRRNKENASTGLPVKETNESTPLTTFSGTSGKSFQTPESARQEVNKTFENINNYNSRDCKSPTKETASPTVSSKEVADNTLSHKFSRKSPLENFNSPKLLESSLEKLDSKTPKPGNFRGSKLFSTPQNQTRPKRKLGMSSCKQIPIPERVLHKASILFDEDLSGISPIKPTGNHTTPDNRKPLISERTGTGPICIRNPSKERQASSTPISKNLFNGAYTMVNDFFTITFPEGRNCKTWLENIENEKQELQKRLEMITERQRWLTLIEENVTSIDRKPRTGTLLQKKCNSRRMSMRDLVGNRKPGDCSGAHPLWCVTPQNAEQFHFTMYTTSTLTTGDGCVIVPNPKNLVGVHEIEYSFRNMPGVEPSLLPKDWIRNHYKWVIWKLASYERTFPEEFNGVLCVENVIQQLKYRYDREIDKAERSALRKIFEKDDIAQKRMVLCVSDIRKIGANIFTLELTDGWYGIKTLIDDPLCNQIISNKLKVGVKLVTYNAELLNCDGCSPLEATDLVSLKINYNCTRRARWDDRLGYQDHLGPFPVPIETINPNGGMVGLVGINIIRTYPLKFLEKINGQSVWRNKRAEERRAQEWENERDKQIEQIHEEMRQQYDRCHNERSDDLTQEFTLKISEEMEKLKASKRDVVCSFKLLITDRNGDGTRTFNFWIWCPTDWHFGMMKEGTSFLVYNALPRKNGDLSSSKRTFFKPITKRTETPDVFKRRVTKIDQLTEKEFNSFHEFDTVGIVVDVTVDRYQFIWLSDQSGRLLLIKIYESPQNCLLLDVKKGQAITVCNVTFKKRHSNDIMEAVGSSSTILSMYSQYKHLQEGLNDFKANLPKDCDGLLDECSKRIRFFSVGQSARTDSFLSDDDEDNTLTHSKLTRTDIALSLMDIDIGTNK